MILKCNKCEKEINLELDHPTYSVKAKGFYCVCPKCKNFILMRDTKSITFPGFKRVKRK